MIICKTGDYVVLGTLQNVPLLSQCKMSLQRKWDVAEQNPLIVNKAHDCFARIYVDQIGPITVRNVRHCNRETIVLIIFISWLEQKIWSIRNLCFLTDSTQSRIFGFFAYFVEISKDIPCLCKEVLDERRFLREEPYKNIIYILLF